MNEINKDVEEINIRELYETINKMKKDLQYINKNSKKNIMSIESLREDINKNTEQKFKLKRQLEEKNERENKIYKKIIKILDLMDIICESSLNLDNEEFINNLDIIKKVIRKEINEIDLVEIKSLGELFNPELHKCIAVEKDTMKKENEIISVIEKGYMLQGKVIRPASVIIAR